MTEKPNKIRLFSLCDHVGCSINEAGRNGASNTITALEHSEPIREVRHMSHHGQYGDSPPEIKRQSKAICASVLRDLLSYDPDTGRLRWKVRDQSLFETGANPKRICSVWNAKHAGCLADNVLTQGYRSVCIFDKRYPAHRVAWAIHYGNWPLYEIDHINQNKADNRLVNLRDVPHRINAKNQPIRSDNKTGLTGIWQKSPKAWGAKWLVVQAGDSRIIGRKSFKCLGQAVRYRNAQYKLRGYTEQHGTWQPIRAVAARLVEGAKK